ncbi:MAG TPA: hypothetical protein DDZ80_12930 [Cyanobacteria bacterium UBA8803]|nr:hypothetical protein [Cyanobacteria bacterium UBA9273]HBL59378.1 hypothetical protein [Cyanobacteria bacterium UBA8803]
MNCAVAQTPIQIYIFLPWVHPMIYNDMPVIIPVLATVYLLAIYLLLIVAQRTIKSSRYLANSLTDACGPQAEEGEGEG